MMNILFFALKIQTDIRLDILDMTLQEAGTIYGSEHWVI